MVELYLARHGETEDNLKHILQGRKDSRLSPHGVEQAQDLARRMEQIPLDVILSSELSRSRLTAAAVAQLKPHALFMQTPLLNEIDTGIYTGMPAEVLDWHNLPDSGMETLEEMFARAQTLLAWIRKSFEGKSMLAVGHGAYNRAIVCAINGLPCREMLELPIMQNVQVMHFYI